MATKMAHVATCHVTAFAGIPSGKVASDMDRAQIAATNPATAAQPFQLAGVAP